MKKVFSIILYVIFLIASFNAKSQEKELKNFWRNFQKAVTETDDSAVVALSFFSNEEEKQYFNFELIFDEDAINKIKNSSTYDLEKVQRIPDELNDNPFDILGLPEEINEVYILTVESEYEDEESMIAYDRIYVFGKFEGKFKFQGFYTVE
ncbi:MAG: hypothetical protein V1779_13050 [bacterium]